MINSDRFVLNLNSKKLLIVIISLQLAFLGLIALDSLGLGIPILRQVLGFLYLTFVPGILLLGILRINNLSTTETILYSVGLSLSFLMFTGTLINFLYPLIGISRPISEKPILFTINFVTFILSVIYYLKLKGASEPYTLSLNWLLHSSNLALLLLLFSSILGTLFLNYYGNNLLLLVCFAAISIIPILVALDKVSARIYPFAIWIIALCLVLYNSLYGDYTRLTDNFVEFYLVQNTLQNQIWDISIPNNVNAMPGVMIILPTYLLISRLSLVYLYKIIVPFLSSFIPLGLYIAFEKRFQPKIAFLSSFFFISMFNFFTWASITMKMCSSGIFLSLLVLLIMSKDSSINHKKALGIIFCFGLILSHYGTSYMFMLALILSLTFLIVLKAAVKNIDIQQNYHISSSFIACYMVFAIGWYMYITQSSSFESIVLNSKHFIDSITTEFIFAESYGKQLLLGKFPLYLQILKYLYTIAYLLILLGVTTSLLKGFKEKKLSEFMLISLPFLLFIPLPYLFGVGQYAGGRAFLIPCYFLSPFLVLGCLLQCFYKNWTKKGLVLAGVFLSIFFLFNSGFASEVIWKYNVGPSVCVSAPRITGTGTIEEKEYLNWRYPTAQDMEGAKWLSNFIDNCRVFCGYSPLWRELYLAGLTPGHVKHKIGKAVTFQLHKGQRIAKKSYIYLNSFNIETGKITEIKKHFHMFFNLNEFSEQLDSSNKIYTNGGSVIYYR